MKRRAQFSMKSVVGKGSKHIASDYIVNQTRGFILCGLRRMLAESDRKFAHVSCIEGRSRANGHPDDPTTPCACCGDPVAVPCAVCANAWRRGLASLVLSGAVVVDGEELRPGDLEMLLAVPDPVWRTA